MKITPVRGEELRYIVESESEEKSSHMVDLQSNDGNGECSCTDFSARRGPNYAANGKRIVNYSRDAKGKTNSESTRCKHIHECVLYFANDALAEAVQHYKPKARPKPLKQVESADSMPF